jgi:hypothetical protein
MATCIRVHHILYHYSFNIRNVGVWYDNTLIALLIETHKWYIGFLARRRHEGGPQDVSLLSYKP